MTIIEKIIKLFKSKGKNNRELVVVSLFDGISCGRVALEKIGLKVSKYYAYEINKYAIEITQNNYPDTIQMGSVVGADFKQFKGKVDLVMGGSPCQNLSIAGNRKGLAGEESKLFYEFVRALKEIEPKYFLLENNASMTQENQDIITSYMGVKPIYINSNLFSAQNRRRLYWTNILGIKEPKDKKLFIKDIVEPKNKKQAYECTEKMRAKKLGTLAYKKAWGNVKTLNEKSNCLTCGQSISNSGATVIKYSDDEYYIPTPVECERLQNLPDNYTSGGGKISKTQRYKCIGNSWTVDVIAHLLKGIKDNENR